LILFPFLAWIAVATSAALLVVLRWTGDLAGRALAVLFAWFLVAAALQFFGPSEASSVAGLALQTALAVYLVLRWKVSSL